MLSFSLSPSSGFLVSLLDGMSAHSGMAPRVECTAVQTGEDMGLAGMKQSVGKWLIADF